MANWHELIEIAMKKNGDNWGDMSHCTLGTRQLLVEFDDDLGVPEGVAFTAWSVKWVYFPVVNGGAEWVDFVPRSLCDYAKIHVGAKPPE